MGNAFNATLNVLLADRDRSFAEAVRGGLEEESCTVKVCFDGGSGLRQAEGHAFDVILLDTMLPILDGVEVTRRLRLLRVQTPILLLAARDASEDLVKGLEAGADDYVPKSVGFQVLLARIRARTRPAAERSLTHLRFADLFLNSEKHDAMRAGRRLELTRTEFLILECLMLSAGRVVRRNRIIDFVWKDREISENNLDVFIRSLRTKVDRPGLSCLLHTERGVGYSIRESMN